jgi:iron complex outermembrane receptor protein
MPMENKERVEVLKGSSALYYGFTSPAGVVNMVTKRARTEPITMFALSGNDSGQMIGTSTSAASSADYLGVRVNVAGGEVRVPIDHYEGQRQLIAGAFDIRLTEQLTIKADFENIRRSAVEQASVSILPATNNVIPLPNIPDPEKLLSGPWALTNGRIANHQIRADYYITPGLGGDVRVRARRDRPLPPRLLADAELQHRHRRRDAARGAHPRPVVRQQERPRELAGAPADRGSSTTT